MTLGGLMQGLGASAASENPVPSTPRATAFVRAQAELERKQELVTSLADQLQRKNTRLVELQTQATQVGDKARHTL